MRNPTDQLKADLELIDRCALVAPSAKLGPWRRALVAGTLRELGTHRRQFCIGRLHAAFKARFIASKDEDRPPMVDCGPLPLRPPGVVGDGPRHGVAR